MRPDGAEDADTPLETIAAHVRHVADRIGVDHVALGSDFDGATIPDALGDVTGLPRLLDAIRATGFSEDEMERIAWGNWRRVLEAAWATRSAQARLRRRGLRRPLGERCDARPGGSQPLARRAMPRYPRPAIARRPRRLQRLSRA